MEGSLGAKLHDLQEQYLEDLWWEFPFLQTLNLQLRHKRAQAVLKKIKACETGTWEHMVPKGVSNIIIEKSLFGMKCKIK